MVDKFQLNLENTSSIATTNTSGIDSGSQASAKSEPIPIINPQPKKEVDELRLKVIQKYNLPPDISDELLEPYMQKYVQEVMSQTQPQGLELEDKVKSEPLPDEITGDHLHAHNHESGEVHHNEHTENARKLIEQYANSENAKITITVSEEKWNSLSPKDQKMFLEEEAYIANILKNNNNMSRDEWDKLSKREQTILKNEYDEKFLDGVTRVICGKSENETLSENDKIHAMEHLLEAGNLPRKVEALLKKNIALFNKKQSTFDPVTGENVAINPGEKFAVQELLENADEKTKAKYNEAVQNSETKKQNKIIADLIEQQYFKNIDWNDRESVKKAQEQIFELLGRAENVEEFEMINKATLRISGRKRQSLLSDVRGQLNEPDKRIAKNAIATTSTSEMSDDAIYTVAIELNEDAENGNNEYLNKFAITNPSVTSKVDLDTASSMIVNTTGKARQVTISYNAADGNFKLINEAAKKAEQRGEDPSEITNAYVKSVTAEHVVTAARIYDGLSAKNKARAAHSGDKILARRTRDEKDFKPTQEAINKFGKDIRAFADDMPEAEAIQYLKDLSDNTASYHVDYQKSLYELDVNSKYTEVQEYAASNIYKLDESVRQWAEDYTKSLNIESVSNAIQTEPPVETQKSTVNSNDVVEDIVQDYQNTQISYEENVIPVSTTVQEVRSFIEDSNGEVSLDLSVKEDCDKLVSYFEENPIAMAKYIANANLKNKEAVLVALCQSSKNAALSFFKSNPSLGRYALNCPKIDLAIQSDIAKIMLDKSEKGSKDWEIASNYLGKFYSQYNQKEQNAKPINFIS